MARRPTAEATNLELDTLYSDGNGITILITEFENFLKGSKIKDSLIPQYSTAAKSFFPTIPTAAKSDAAVTSPLAKSRAGKLVPKSASITISHDDSIALFRQFLQSPQGRNALISAQWTDRIGSVQGVRSPLGSPSSARVLDSAQDSAAKAALLAAAIDKDLEERVTKISPTHRTEGEGEGEGEGKREAEAAAASAPAPFADSGRAATDAAPRMPTRRKVVADPSQAQEAIRKVNATLTENETSLREALLKLKALYQKTKEDLGERISIQDNALEVEKARVIELTKTVTELRGAYNSQLTALTTQLDDERQQHLEKESEFFERYKVLSSDYERVNAEIVSATTDLHTTTIQLKEAENKLLQFANIEQSFQDELAKNARLSANLTTLRTELQQILKQHQETSETIAATQRQKDAEAEDTSNELERQLRVATEQNVRLSAENNERKSRAEELQTELSAKTEELRVLNAQREEAQRQIIAKTEENTVLSDSIALLEARLDQVTQESNTSSTDILSLRTEMNALQDAHRNRVAELEDNISALNQNILALQQKIASKDRTIAEKDRTIETAGNLLKDIGQMAINLLPDDKRPQLQQELSQNPDSAIANAVAAVGQLVTALKSEISNANSEITTRNDTIARLQTQLDMARAGNTDAAAAARAHEQQIQSLTTDHTAALAGKDREIREARSQTLDIAREFAELLPAITRATSIQAVDSGNPTTAFNNAKTYISDLEKSIQDIATAAINLLPDGEKAQARQNPGQIPRLLTDYVAELRGDAEAARRATATETQAKDTAIAARDTAIAEKATAEIEAKRLAAELATARQGAGAQVQAANAEKARAETEAKRLATELEAAQRATATETQAKDAAIAAINTANDQKARAEAEANGLRDELATARQDAGAQVQAANAAQARAEAEANGLRDQLEAAQRATATETQAKDAAIAAINTANDQKARAEAEANGLRDELATARQDLTAAQQNAGTQVRAANAAQARAEAEAKGLAAQLEAAQRDLETARKAATDNQAAAARVAGLERNLEAAQREILLARQNAAQERAGKEHAINAADQFAAQASTLVNALRGENNNLKDSIGALEAQLNATRLAAERQNFLQEILGQRGDKKNYHTIVVTKLMEKGAGSAGKVIADYKTSLNQAITSIPERDDEITTENALQIFADLGNNDIKKAILTCGGGDPTTRKNHKGAINDISDDLLSMDSTNLGIQTPETQELIKDCINNITQGKLKQFVADHNVISRTAAAGGVVVGGRR